MRTVHCLFLVVWVSLVAVEGQTVETTLTEVRHAWTAPRDVSVFLKFKGPKALNIGSAPHGEKTRSYTQVWEGLHLQIYSMGHAEVKDGEWGYFVDFTRDQAGQERVRPSQEPSHGKTASTITATDFVEGDKLWPAVLGTMYTNAPGEYRVLDYPQFTVAIRTLEYQMIKPNNGVPSFDTYSCLIRITEKTTRNRE